MQACGVDMGELTDRHPLSRHRASIAQVDSDTDPSPTSGFQRVVQRAILHVQSSGKDEVTGANVLVALFLRAWRVPSISCNSKDMSRLGRGLLPLAWRRQGYNFNAGATAEGEREEKKQQSGREEGQARSTSSRSTSMRRRWRAKSIR